MTIDQVLKKLKRMGRKKTVEEMLSRYGIPNGKAFGVPMNEMLKFAKQLGTDHELAEELWASRWYEARTVAALIDDPELVSKKQMDQWAADFDSWAICDTVCFRLFDRTSFAWEKAPKWMRSRKEFIKRASFTLLWALSVHDKKATNSQFKDALKWIETCQADDRPLVKKAIDMALRAIGKRNKPLNKAAISVAKRMAGGEDESKVWVGKKALRELESVGVQQRLGN